ncbi:hypothetical protein QBC43DRAFT_296978 [Cladorrhinum sp. PSN259]|nr:hypothetical protein QBC43DRAFT_296978 [Cladorrhinum sp. PSN259]
MLPDPASSFDPWKRIGLSLLSFTWFSFVLGLNIFLIIWGVFPSPPSACKPDNSFSPFADDYTWWSEGSFFEITLKGGSLTFAQAKVIDICWDLMVGRGGQALVAYLSWQTFARYLSVSVERAPVTFTTFRECFSNQETSILLLCRLAKDLRLFHQLSPRLVKAFFTFTLSLVLIFPTLASAMTGYSPKSQAFVKELGGNAYIKFSDFDLVAYVIHDAWRIPGQSGDLKIPYPKPDSRIDPVVSKADYTMSMYTSFKVENCEAGLTLEECRARKGQECDFLRIVDSYVQLYGFYGLTDQSTVLRDGGCMTQFIQSDPRQIHKTNASSEPIALPAPALNISAFYLPPHPEAAAGDLYGYDWTDPRTSQYPFRNKTRAMFMADNQTYTVNDIIEHGRCQPVSDQYQWGFSYLQLFITSILLLVWTTGIGLLWLKAEINLPLSQYQSGVPQGWACILHMARTLRRELKSVGIKTTKGLTDKAIEDVIRDRLSGGQISLGAEVEEHDAILGVREWVLAWGMRERCWTVAFVFHCVVYVAVIFLWLLWEPVWVLLVAAWVTCLALHLIRLLGLTKLMWFVLGLFWLAVGMEGLRMSTSFYK